MIKPGPTSPPSLPRPASATPPRTPAASSASVTTDAAADGQARGGPKAGAAQPAAPRAATPASASPARLDDGPTPCSWEAVRVGSLVLATTGPMEGWFECRVVATRADDRFLLQWRDWPKEPEITRRRDQLALLHPATDPKG